MLMRIQFAAPCFAVRSIKTMSVRLFHRCRSLASDGKKTILVTGATGMMGSHFVAKALAAESSWTIACLVRGENSDVASQRLAEKLKLWNRRIPEDEITHPRMIAVKGDICEPQLGMSDCDYDRWSAQVDAVVHFAADIRITKGDESASVNMRACDEVFQFTNKGSKQPHLHFMSTIGSCALLPGTASETLDHTIDHILPGGYGEQKWKAERFLAECVRKRTDPTGKINLSIYRTPFVIDNTMLQPWTVPDFLFQIASLTKTVPEGVSYLPMHNLNSISKCVIINILRTMEQDDKVNGSGGNVGVYHLADTRRMKWEDQVAMLNEAGLGVSIVPWEDYKAQLKETCINHENPSKLWKGLPILEASLCYHWTTLCTSKMQRICQDEANFNLSTEGNLSSDDFRDLVVRR